MLRVFMVLLAGGSLAFWLVGAVSRPRRWGNFVLGGIVVIGGGVAAWRNRQQLGRFALWLIGIVSLAGWLIAVSVAPGRMVPVVVAGTALLLWWLAADRGPIARRLDGRTLTQALTDRIMTQQVGAEVHRALEGTTIGRPTQLPGRMVVDATLPSGSTSDQLDGEAVATGLAKRFPVAHVDVFPSPHKADKATLVVHEERPRDPWEILAAVDNTWTYSGGEGYDPVPLGPCIDPITGEVIMATWDWYRRPHLLVAGSTGAGKTGLQHATFAECAHRRHVQIVALDPEAVEFAAYDERALWVARGPKECWEGIRWVFDVMEDRRRWLDKRGLRFFQVGVHGPLLLAKIDELAGVAMKSGYNNVSIPGPDGEDYSTAKLADQFKGILDQLAARARKWGVRLEVGTQQPAASLFEDTRVRNNFGNRIGMWMMETIGTREILGQGAPDCTAIPDLKGAGYLLRAGERGAKLYVPMRAALIVPRARCADADEALGVAAREIAHETAHLRNASLYYDTEETA